MRKNILVTGATGFIGRHLITELLQRNSYTVYCLVRNAQKADFLRKMGVELIEGDISTNKVIDTLNQYSFNIVFHCAAYLISKHPDRLYRINVEGTKYICQVAYQQRVERMVFLSSVAVVDGYSMLPIAEDVAYCAENPYGESKIEAEKIIDTYRKKGLRAVIMRPPMVYGEDEPHMMKIILFLVKHRLLPLFNEGKTRLHLVYVENLVKALLFSLEKEEFLNGAFFVADKEVLSLCDIVAIMRKATGAQPPLNISRKIELLLLNLPKIGKLIQLYTKERAYNIERIQSIGFDPPYPTHESLEKSCRLFLSNRQY